MLVRQMWLKYIKNREGQFVGYLHIMDLINTLEMEYIKTQITSILGGPILVINVPDILRGRNWIFYAI